MSAGKVMQVTNSVNSSFSRVPMDTSKEIQELFQHFSDLFRRFSVTSLKEPQTKVTGNKTRI